jgi:hypothetical protein
VLSDLLGLFVGVDCTGECVERKQEDRQVDLIRFRNHQPNCGRSIAFSVLLNQVIVLTQFHHFFTLLLYFLIYFIVFYFILFK